MDRLNQLIGENLRKIRADRVLSLDAAARVTGVSKSMLGQIERGEVNPTISTLWRIANGLKVSFSSLVTAPENDYEVVRRSGTEPLVEDDGRVRNYPAFPFDAERSFEMYLLEIDGGGALEADPHAPGTQELLTLHSGELIVRAGEQEHLLGAGDSVRFRADAPHSYRNAGTASASLSMVIYYPRTT